MQVKDLKKILEIHGDNNIKTRILEFIICFILYLIISKFIDINFGSFTLGLVFPVIVIIISHVLKGLIK